MVLIGLDIGGTKMEVAAIKTNSANVHQSSFELEILDRRRAPTERQLVDVDTIVSKLSDLLQETLEKLDLSINDIDGFGIGLPGSVDPNSKKMINGNCLLFKDTDFCGNLQERIKYPREIFCANDANCFALAETLCGIGKEYQKISSKPPSKQLAVGIILGTGVGGGIIFNGNIIPGKNGGCGEFGHSKLISNGHPCFCGKNGCAEQYLSGPALEALFHSRIYSQIPKRLNASEIFQLVENNDPMAIAVVKQYKKHLVKFLNNINTIIDPDYFVLGGGVSSQDNLYIHLEELIAHNSFIPSPGTRVFKHILGDSAGVIGASLLPLISPK